jgi:hypothetical protein
MEDKLSKLGRGFGWSDDTSTRMVHRSSNPLRLTYLTQSERGQGGDFALWR